MKDTNKVCEVTTEVARALIESNKATLYTERATVATNTRVLTSKRAGLAKRQFYSHRQMTASGRNSR